MILIRNARVLTMEDDKVIQGGEILMDGGKIVDVGSALSAPGAQVVDARGMYALPGVVDAHCHIGMFEDGMGFEGDDGNEATDPLTPQLRALDAINPMDRCFSEALSCGVTCAATGPGSANVIGGQFLAMKTNGHDLEQMVIQEPLAMKAAFGENPKRVYSGKHQAPETRMATAAILRNALMEAREYLKKKEQGGDKAPDFDLKKEMLSKVLTRELLLKCHAHRADDILTAIRIAKEFNLRISLEHCTEGYLIADALKRANVPCILGPLLSDRSKIELRNMSFKAPGILHKAGVRFALMTDHPVIPMQYLMVEAGICAREGLDEMEALRAVTLNAAWAIGLDGRLGSLKPGKDADVALYDGHPMDTRTRVKQVYVNGQLAYED
ncbi:MAG TPA: amidohydrolase [Candidatus Faecaligallichristensenella faecipullorum]|nr:amidohydrolase [Candidatus Faecaligallichristensenella faecipullorum]